MSFMQCKVKPKVEEKPEILIRFYKQGKKVKATYITSDMKAAKPISLPKAVDAVRFKDVWVGDKLYKNITFEGEKYANRFLEASTK